MEEITLQVSNLISFKDAAQMLGVSRPTIYVLIKKQQLHPIRIGYNQYLFRAELGGLRDERQRNNDST